MSKLATDYRLYYADTNTVIAADIYDGTGGLLTPLSIADGVDDPVGWKTKTITFTDPTEAVFVTPTFSNPAAPVLVYLTRVALGEDRNVLSEEVFNPTAPTRPTPRGDKALRYEAVLGGEDLTVKTWEIKLPVGLTVKVTPRTRDPLTGLKLYGNDFRLLFTGTHANELDVQCDIEDITDPDGFEAVPFSNITSYAESSVGKSLIKIDSEIIPRDGFIHALRFRVRYILEGDTSEWVESAWVKAVYALEPPSAPESIAVTVLRDRDDVVPDRIKLDWTWSQTNPGEVVELFAIDQYGKKHSLGEEGENAVTTMTVENVTRFYQVDRPPAVQTPYRFGIIAKNRSSASDMVLTAAPVMLTCKIRDAAPLTPDEVAGIAVDLTPIDFLTVASAAVNNLQGLTLEQKAALAPLMGHAVKNIFTEIKRVVMKGGSVTVEDFGVFRAKWRAERYAYNSLTGEPVLVPATRYQSFSGAKGYKVGTERGQILTDAEARALS